MPAQLRSGFGIYAVFEQQVLKSPEQDERSLSVFIDPHAEGDL